MNDSERLLRLALDEPPPSDVDDDDDDDDDDDQLPVDAGAVLVIGLLCLFASAFAAAWLPDIVTRVLAAVLMGWVLALWLAYRLGWLEA